MVGIDGPEGADAALAWAVGEARLRHARLEVVRSFTHPIMGDLPTAADADALLVKEAELVVGSRGRGGFAGLVLGSVSQQCAQHAPCPIVIVPSPRR